MHVFFFKKNPCTATECNWKIKRWSVLGDFLVSFLLWLELVIENDLNGCKWTHLYFTTWPAICDPKHFFQMTWSGTIRAQHVRPHVHLQKNLKSPPLWKTTQLWLFYTFVSLFVWVPCSMASTKKRWVFRFEHVLSCIKITRFFKPRLCPTSCAKFASGHGKSTSFIKKLPSSDLTKTSGWAHPNWCSLCCCSIFLIFLRKTIWPKDC